MKIYCFGNEFWKADSIVKRLVDDIVKCADVNGIEFIKCNGPDDLGAEKDLIIMDVVKGIDKVMIIDDINQLKDFDLSNCAGCHDIDLGYWLKLRREIGELDSVKIIGVPELGNLNLIKEKVINQLFKLSKAV